MAPSPHNDRFRGFVVVLRLILRRLAGLPVLLLIVSLGVFSLVALIPGDPAVMLAGGENASLERVAEVREELGLDRPFFEQYVDWLGGALRLDFGESLVNGEDVTDGIQRRMPVTLSVVMLAIVLGLALGLPAGMIAGTKPGTFADRLGIFAASVGLAIPSFWFAMVLIWVFSIQLHWVPSIGFTRITESPLDWFRSAILPAMALSAFVAANIARQLRAGLIGVMGSHYVRTAWAKGSTTRNVVGKHALKNASTSAITVLGLMFASLLGGSVVVEQIFSIPGIGTYMLEAVTRGDLPVVQGVVMFFVLVNVILTLMLDIVYGLLNPKVRVS
jgi:peptide/nickel transport system permease protein